MHTPSAHESKITNPYMNAKDLCNNRLPIQPNTDRTNPNPFIPSSSAPPTTNTFTNRPQKGKTDCETRKLGKKVCRRFPALRSKIVHIHKLSIFLFSLLFDMWRRKMAGTTVTFFLQSLAHGMPPIYTLCVLPCRVSYTHVVRVMPWCSVLYLHPTGPRTNVSINTRCSSSPRRWYTSLSN